MNAVLEIVETKITRQTRLRLIRAGDEGNSNVMAIHTGLSVTVCGHLIRLDRDENARTAKIVVQSMGNYTLTGLELEAVKAAADLLLDRARRFLGGGWVVEAWEGGDERRIGA